MQRLGRFSHLILELTLGAAICFAIALLTPLSVWPALGDVGAGLAILGVAASVLAVVIKRNVRNSDSWTLPRSTAVTAAK